MAANGRHNSDFTNTSTEYKEYDEPDGVRMKRTFSKIKDEYGAIKFLLKYYSNLMFVFVKGNNENTPGLKRNDLALAQKMEEMGRNFTNKKGNRISKADVCHFYHIVRYLDQRYQRNRGSINKETVNAINETMMKFNYTDYDTAMSILFHVCAPPKM